MLLISFRYNKSHVNTKLALLTVKIKVTLVLLQCPQTGHEPNLHTNN